MRKSARKVDIIIIAVILLLAAIAIIAAVIPEKPEEQALQTDVSKLNISDYADKKIGVTTGTLFETFVKENYPDAQISYFNSVPDLITAIKTERIDTFLLGEDSAMMLEAEDPTIAHIPDPAGYFDLGIMFSKTERGDKLKNQMDEFLTGLNNDGTLDEIKEFWKSEEGKHTSVDISELSGENGTLRFVTSGDRQPSSFIVDGKLAGHDPDIAVRFCREYGYDIEMSISDFSGIIPGLVLMPKLSDLASSCFRTKSNSVIQAGTTGV